jgi:hypothetical protein
MPEPICQTFDNCNVYGFIVDQRDNELFAIACAWDEAIVIKYCQKLPDETTVIEWSDDDFSGPVEGPWYGDIPPKLFGEELPSTAVELTPEAAQKYIEEIQTQTTVTENSVVWCNVTLGYYEDDYGQLSQYLFWSENSSCIIGPGSEYGRLTESIENPAEELWAIFDLSPIEGIQQLRRVLDERLPREICAANPLKYHSYGPNSHTFGLFGYEHDADAEDGVKWLNSLGGKSLDTLRQAELDTIEQIDLWLKSKE